VILLDTAVVAAAVRGEPDERVIEWLNAQLYDTVYICAPTAAEVIWGCLKLPKGKRENRLGVAPEDRILKVFEKRILAFDLEAARAYGAIMKEVRRQGVSISRKDAEVAAVAKSYGLTVACLDRSPFLRAGVGFVEVGGGCCGTVEANAADTAPQTCNLEPSVFAVDLNTGNP